MSEMIERVARAIESTMFAAHEMPLPAELHEKYLATARAAIEAMPGWQPIDTYSPAHALNVLVVDEGVVSEAYYDGESDSWFKDGKSEYDFDFVSSDRLFPTHWMLMPAPPKPDLEASNKDTGSVT